MHRLWRKPPISYFLSLEQRKRCDWVSEPRHLRLGWRESSTTLHRRDKQQGTDPRCKAQSWLSASGSFVSSHPFSYQGTNSPAFIWSATARLFARKGMVRGLSMLEIASGRDHRNGCLFLTDGKAGPTSKEFRSDASK